MKRILIFATTIMLAFIVAACGNRNAKSNTTDNVTAVEVDYIMTNAETLIDQQIEVEAICTHLCSHGATKMFLMGSDESKIMRVEAAKLGSFKQKCANSIVKVNGILREERIDEAYLQTWEQTLLAEGEQHGDGESGCATEKAARGETGNSSAERIADFRAKIAARNESEGKAYLSFYFIEALSYEII